MEIQITSLSQFIEVLESQEKSAASLFRGHRELNYKLIPTIGRLDFFRGNLNNNEKSLLKQFKESAIPYIDYSPASDWEWLALGQHYGLPTRFLDWTYNPLVALFFAVEFESIGDSIVYGVNLKFEIDLINEKPFTLSKVKRYTPKHISDRILNQNGCFTVHPKPTEEYNPSTLKKYIIKKEIRGEIKKMLFKVGIRSRFIYPGLDGISKDLKWLRTKSY